MKRFLKSISLYVLGFMTIAVAMGATWVKLSPQYELRAGVMVTSGGTYTGSVMACLNCSGQNFIAGLRDAYNGNLYISTGAGGSSPILWTAVDTGVALGSSDILIPSQNAVSGFVNTKIASYLPLANSGTYFNLFSGTYFNLYSGTYFNANSGVYFEANSGKYFNANSGTYFQANSGVYFNLYSGTYFNANSGTYYNTNPKGYITGSSLTPYCLLSGNQTLTGIFTFAEGFNLFDQTASLATCTGSVLGRVVYYNDNYYGCTAQGRGIFDNHAAGSNTYVQFNSGGVFGAVSSFNFQIAYGMLGVGGITATPLVDMKAGTFRRFSGLQLNNVLEIQTEANGFLAGIQPDGDITTTGTIKIGNTVDACDSTGAGIMKFSGDNFYGCKVASGRVLLN